MERTVPTPPAVRFTIGLNTWAHKHPMMIARRPFQREDGSKDSHIGAWCEDCRCFVMTTKGKVWIGEIELPHGINKDDLPERGGAECTQ